MDSIVVLFFIFWYALSYLKLDFLNAYDES